VFPQNLLSQEETPGLGPGVSRKALSLYTLDSHATRLAECSTVGTLDRLHRWVLLKPVSVGRPA